MKRHRLLAAATFAAALGASSPATATQDTPKAASGAENLSHIHDFDFLVGEWKVHHRRLKERLTENHEWIEFEGTLAMQKLMDGRGNVDDNWLDMPGGAYRAVGLRSYDSKTGLWAIWWLDGRDPHGNLDPPVKGNFENGVGTFYSDDTLRGKPVRVRFQWSHITPTTAQWEQAYSPDAGKTWETNWVMHFERVGKAK